MGDVAWELAVALDEHLDCGWTENTERTQEPEICLTAGNRDSYSQQKGEWIRQKCPAQFVTMSCQGGGF